MRTVGRDSKAELDRELVNAPRVSAHLAEPTHKSWVSRDLVRKDGFFAEVLYADEPLEEEADALTVPYWARVFGGPDRAFSEAAALLHRGLNRERPRTAMPLRGEKLAIRKYGRESSSPKPMVDYYVEKLTDRERVDGERPLFTWETPRSFKSLLGAMAAHGVTLEWVIRRCLRQEINHPFDIEPIVQGMALNSRRSYRAKFANVFDALDPKERPVQVSARCSQELADQIRAACGRHGVAFGAFLNLTLVEFIGLQFNLHAVEHGVRDALDNWVPDFAPSISTLEAMLLARANPPRAVLELGATPAQILMTTRLHRVRGAQRLPVSALPSETKSRISSKGEVYG